MMASFGMKLVPKPRCSDKKFNEHHYLCLRPISCRHTCKKNKNHKEPCGLGNCPFQRLFRRRCGHNIYRPCVGGQKSCMPDCMWPCAVPQKDGSPCEELCCDCGFLIYPEEDKEKQSSPVMELLKKNEEVPTIGIDESIPENLVKLPNQKKETIERKRKRNQYVAMETSKKGKKDIQKPVQNLTNPVTREQWKNLEERDFANYYVHGRVLNEKKRDGA